MERYKRSKMEKKGLVGSPRNEYNLRTVLSVIDDLWPEINPD